jgi:hypothetical protein
MKGGISAFEKTDQSDKISDQIARLIFDKKLLSVILMTGRTGTYGR